MVEGGRGRGRVVGWRKSHEEWSIARTEAIGREPRGHARIGVTAKGKVAGSKR